MVTSAAFLSSLKLFSIHALISSASVTDLAFITGALVILSPIILVVTPPAPVMTEHPLFIDAIRAPSDVARGT